MGVIPPGETIYVGVDFARRNDSTAFVLASRDDAARLFFAAFGGLQAKPYWRRLLSFVFHGPRVWFMPSWHRYLRTGHYTHVIVAEDEEF